LHKSILETTEEIKNEAIISREYYDKVQEEKSELLSKIRDLNL